MPTSNVRSSVPVLALSAWVIAAAITNEALAISWPQEITAPEGKVIVYQPQPEKLDGTLLTGRAATSLELTGKSDPIFGAFWFQARIDTDQDSGTALIRDVKITKVRWPESKDAGEQRFTSVIEKAVPTTGFEISLPRLSASLAASEKEDQSLREIKNEPPIIIFRKELAVLLLYDGEPRFSKIENSTYERAVNTPLVVVRENSSRYFLTSGQLWYESQSALGPWTPTTSPPSDLVKLVPKPDDKTPPPEPPPAIVVATQPTDLIVSQGAPDWNTLPGSEILYVTNTETPWLRDLSTGNVYVLLSGRWYRAKSQQGPWTFVRADELPKSFADIPPASDIGGVRTSVADTSEADDAILDAQIPQTAAIKKGPAKINIEYDGKPKFEQINGTTVSYAVNTGAQVLKIDNKYYAVENGVFYASSSAEGPWAVAESLPEEAIATIPPSSPVYNVTYVKIYETTPSVVYYGYTPGYMWSFPYYGVPIYGTGWYYPPYIGPGVYYPRTPTWGMHVGYNPYTGWNFGVSWSNGFLSMGVSWGGGYHHGCCGGWYGGGYRGPTFVNTGNINIGNSINVGNQAKFADRVNNSSKLNRNVDRNIYNRPENRSRNADRAGINSNVERARSTLARDNNVFADKNGNVARLNNNEWQSRSQGQWQRDSVLSNSDSGLSNRDTGLSNRDSGLSSRNSGLGNRGADLNFANQARQHGVQRERQSFGGGRDFGGRGGGGFRRR